MTLSAVAETVLASDLANPRFYAFSSKGYEMSGNEKEPRHRIERYDAWGQPRRSFPNRGPRGKIIRGPPYRIMAFDTSEPGNDDKFSGKYNRKKYDLIGDIDIFRVVGLDDLQIELRKVDRRTSNYLKAVKHILRRSLFESTTDLSNIDQDEVRKLFMMKADK